MANVKISELPVVTSVTNSDVLPVVASTTTSQLTMTNLAKSMPQVSSSISASYALTSSFATTALTATSASYAVSASFEITYETSSSYADFAVSASFALTSSLTTSSSFAVSSSFATSASWAPTTSAFPFTGSARITGSVQILGTLGVTGSILSDSYVQGNKVLGSNWSTQTFGGTKIPAFGTILRQDSYNSSQVALGYTYYFGDNNIGHAVPKEFGVVPAGAIKLVRQQSNTVVGGGPYGAGEGKVPIYTIISDNFSLVDDSTNYNFSKQNGRDHVLTVTGSILSKDAVSLGSNLTDNHIVSGSINVVGSVGINTSGSFILPGTASASPVAGNFYFDFTNNKLYAYNGSNWVTASLGS